MAARVLRAAATIVLMPGDIESILFSREVIDERVKELAAHVQGAYRGEPLTVAVVLNGAFIFAADLVRHLAAPVEIVFVRARSYGDATSPQAAPTVGLPAGTDWTDRHVLLIEDIVDTGHTGKAMMDAIRSRGAASVRLCSFLDKPARRATDVTVDFRGFELDGEPFAVGYGLDFAGRYRNLPYVGVLRADRGQSE